MTVALFSSAEPVPEGPTSDIDVLRVGKWNSTRYGEFEVTKADLDEMVAEFSAANASGRRQIDFDHSANKGDTRAAGWIQGLRIEGDKLRARVEWTPAGQEAVKKREYRFTSAEYKTKIRDKLTGETRDGKSLVACTLTNRPFLENLDPVSLSDDPDARLAVVPEINPADWAKHFQSSISGATPTFTQLGANTGYITTFPQLTEEQANAILLAKGNIGGTPIRHLPDSSYAWIDPEGNVQIPFKDKNGKIDADHVRKALDKLDTVQGLSGAAATKVRRKLEAALQSVGGDPSGNTSNPSRETMSDAIRETLALDDDASEEDVVAAIKALSDKAADDGEPTVTLAAFNEVRAEATKAREAAEEATRKLHTTERDSFLTAQIGAGKLVPAELDAMRELYDVNDEKVKALLDARPATVLREVGEGSGKTLAEIDVNTPEGRQLLAERTAEMIAEAAKNGQKLDYGDAMRLAAKEATG